MESKKLKLFVSKNESELFKILPELTKSNVALFSHSFLSFESIPFEVEGNYDVIFFGSPRSVDFFLPYISKINSGLIACVGNKTAEKLKEYGLEVNFKPNSKSISNSVDKFHEWLGSKSVLFPISDKSIRSFSKGLDPSQREEVVIYKTSIKSQLVTECDAYVFTSPSNFEGFLIENVVPQNSKLIAWGESTSEYINHKGYECQLLPESSVDSILEYFRQ